MPLFQCYDDDARPLLSWYLAEITCMELSCKYDLNNVNYLLLIIIINYCLDNFFIIFTMFNFNLTNLTIFNFLYLFIFYE